jgi:hypothetical protein
VRLIARIQLNRSIGSISSVKSRLFFINPLLNYPKSNPITLLFFFILLLMLLHLNRVSLNPSIEFFSLGLSEYLAVGCFFKWLSVGGELS